MKILSKLAPSFLVICCLMMGSTFQVQAQMVGGTVGSIAPNIELPDQYGNKISLSGLRGNLVLVRFWKSGDPNSRATNSNIFALHQKYKNAPFQTAKGFQVFMVSLDSRLDKWKMALQQDQLPENYHVNDIYSKYVAPYGVRDLPVNFLLDENGTIIANTKSMAELDQELSKRAKVYAATTTTVAPATTISSTPTIYSDLVNTSDRPTPSTFNQPQTNITNVSSAESSYMIQLGAFKNLDINKFLDASEYGFVTAEDAGNGVQRALLGKFNSPEDVVSTLSKLRDKGYPDAFPVEYKNNDRRIIGKKETTAIASKMGITIADAPVRTTTPATMSVATTKVPTTTSLFSTTNTTSNTTTNNGSTHYEYPFSNNNTNSNPITSIPDDAISTTYHGGSSSVITTSTTSTNGNIATHNSSGSTTTGNTTLVPSEIPVFTGGVNPAATYNSTQGTYYDSDAYELSWYPSEPSHAQPNIIESPYYNANPVSKDPNGLKVPNYDNNNNSGWQQQGWSNSTSTNANGTNTQPNTNEQWNTNTQSNTNSQWDMNNQTPATSTYPEPTNQQLDQSLDSYLNSYDFSSVDDNSDRSTSTNKKKKKKTKKRKKKK